MSLFNSLVRSSIHRSPCQLLAKRYYKLSVGSIRKGQVVQFKDKAWKVLNRDHVSSGRGGAVVKVYLYLNKHSLIFVLDGTSRYFIQYKNK